MPGKDRRWRTALALVMVLMAPGPAVAGPYFGEWGLWWHPHKEGCPRGDYSHLHYWAPEVYLLRACVHPSNLDQYPPGPACCPGTTNVEFNKYRCPAIPAMPTSPYADPTAYYGRPVAPPR